MTELHKVFVKLVVMVRKFRCAGDIIMDATVKDANKKLSYPLCPLGRVYSTYYRYDSTSKGGTIAYFFFPSPSISSGSWASRMAAKTRQQPKISLVLIA